MAQFDVHKAAGGRGYLLDCQSQLVVEYETRVVVPLLPVTAFKPASRLHPTFHVDGAQVIMSTHHVFAIPTTRLGPVVGSLAKDRDTIISAIDILWSGV